MTQIVETASDNQPGWLQQQAPVLALWLATRLGLIVVAYVALVMLPTNTELNHPPPDRPDNVWIDSWIRWDSRWYAGIARDGYTNVPQAEAQRDVAFFPLYPVLMRIGGLFVGDTYLSGLLISNLAFLLALILLFRLVADEYDEAVAWRAIVLLSISPYALFFTSLYTESLYLLAAVSVFYFGQRGRWALAALSAAVGSATRLPGILFVVPLLLIYLEQIQFDLRRIRPNILWLLLCPLGALAFFGYLLLQFDVTPADYQALLVEGWGQIVDPLTRLGDVVRNVPIEGLVSGKWDAPIVLTDVMNSIALLLSLVGSIYVLVRVRLSYGVWVLISASVGVYRLTSFGRYTAVMFPLFLALALLLKRRDVFAGVVFISTLILSLLLIRYVNWFWVA